MDNQEIKTSDMKVLILGGAGFIGSNLSQELYKKGDEVTILDALFYEPSPRDFVPLRFVRGDIRKREDLEPEIKRADAVVHLAAMSNDPVCDLDPQITWDINHRANELIASLCAQYGKRIIFASSCSVYGFSESGIFNEDSELNPVSLYAKTKALSEVIYKNHKADAISLRFGTAYGYTEKPRFDLVVNTMIGTAYFNEKIIVNGGAQWRPLIHVGDISRAVYLVLHAGKLPGRIYNIGSNDQNYRIIDLAREIIKHFPEASLQELTDSADGRSYRVDFSRAERELGFRTQYSIKDAVKEFVDAFRANKIVSINLDEYYRIRYLKNNLVPELQT